jgi:hypothetical protein
VALVAQHANDFSRQRLVQDLDHGLSVGLIALGYRTLLDMLTRSFAKRLDVRQKWFISHDVTPCVLCFLREASILLASDEPEQVAAPDSAGKK